MVLLLSLILQVGLLAKGQKSVLVVSAGSGEYLMAAAGTLASLIDDGYAVYVVQIGNDDKNFVGLRPAQSPLANNTETQHAARMIHMTAVLILNHKSAAHHPMRST